MSDTLLYFLSSSLKPYFLAVLASYLFDENNKRRQSNRQKEDINLKTWENYAVYFMSPILLFASLSCTETCDDTELSFILLITIKSWRRWGGRERERARWRRNKPITYICFTQTQFIRILLNFICECAHNNLFDIVFLVAFIVKLWVYGGSEDVPSAATDEIARR